MSFDAPSVDWDAVEHEYAEAARFLRDRARQRRQASFEHLLRFVQRLAAREPACGECSAGNGYACVAPDGTITACHREGGSVIGHLSSGGLDEALRAKWLDSRFYLSAKCLACPIRLVCGGPCRQDGLEHGDLFTPSEAGCRLRRVTFRWAAWLLSELGRTELAPLTGRRGSSCCGRTD
jgi:radical SAM protein with 4Fe4S-binding SPASM domain